MAANTVRELITRVKITLDNQSLNQTNKAINKLKQKMKNLSDHPYKIKVGLNTASLNQISAKIKNKLANTQIKVGVNTASVNQALSRIRRQLSSVNLRLNASITGMTIRASIVNLHGRINDLGNRGGSGGARNRRGGGSIGDLGGSVLGLAAAYGGYVSTGQITGTADAMMSLDGRIKNVTKSEQERLDVESQLYAMGQKTRQSMQNLGDLYLSVASSSSELGFAQKDNLKVTETVAKALAVGGAGAAQASSVILQLGQALGSGTLQGEELNALREGAPGLLREMAKYFKVSMGDLKKMGSEGKLTSKEVMNSILYASAEIDKQFLNTAVTFGQATNVMENSWNRFILKVEQKSTVFSTIAKGFVKAFEDLGNTFDDFTTLMGTPDPKKMVTITEASTGETKQISETDYYAQKAAQNPQMVETIKQLKEFGKWLDELDGKTGNIDEQIASWVKTLIKVGAVLAPILVVLTAISGIITILTPIFSLLGTFFRFLGTIGKYLVKIWRFIYPAIELVMVAIGGLSATTIAVILGIIAVLALVIIYWDEICEAVNTAKDVIMEACGKAADFLADAFNNAINKVKSFFSDLKDFAVGVIGEIVDALGNWLGEKIAWGKQALADLRSFASNAFDGVASRVSTAISNTQTNTYNLSSAGQLAAATDSSNIFFAYRR